MPNGKTHRHKKAIKRRRARRAAAGGLPVGISIGEVMASAGVSYSTAQVELRSEQVRRAQGGESVSNAVGINDWKKQIDDTVVAVTAGTLQPTRSILTWLDREARIAEGHLTRPDLPQEVRDLLDAIVFLDASAKMVVSSSKIASADAALDTLRGTTP